MDGSKPRIDAAESLVATGTLKMLFDHAGRMFVPAHSGATLCSHT